MSILSPRRRALVIAALLAVGCAHEPAPRSKAPVAMTASAATAAPRTIVLIHGMFMTPACWQGWVERFTAQGYTVLAPAWPGHELPVAEQRRRHPDPARGALTLGEVVAHYEQVIRALPERPILMGHSMGGLVVQLLLQKGLGAAGVAIDSAPPKGVLSLKYSFLKSNWPVVSPFARKREPFLPSFDQFRYAFAHTLPEAEARAAYDALVVPESRLVGNGPTTEAARIDFQAPRPPLLLLAGAEDHIIPASLNRSNFERYRKAPAVTELEDLPGRVHFVLGQRGWEEVADRALAWAAAHSGAAPK